MKIVVVICRILLGLIFLLFGLNGFLHFLKAPMPPGPAGQFIGVLFQSHYLQVVSAVQGIGSVLLLVNLYVPFALTILAPVIFNILLFHICLLPVGMGPAIISAILWIILFIWYRQHFSGIFVQRAS